MATVTFYEAGRFQLLELQLDAPQLLRAANLNQRDDYFIHHIHRMVSGRHDNWISYGDLTTRYRYEGGLPQHLSECTKLKLRLLAFYLSYHYD